MNYKQKLNEVIGNRNKTHLFLAFSPIILIIVVATLFAVMVSACIKFTKGPLSTTALLQQLQLLQAKFISGKIVNPETERQEMEIL